MPGGNVELAKQLNNLFTLYTTVYNKVNTAATDTAYLYIPINRPSDCKDTRRTDLDDLGGEF